MVRIFCSREQARCRALPIERSRQTMVILSFGQTATEMGKERSLSGTTTFLTRPTEERGTPIHPVVRLCLGEVAIPELSQLETALRRFSPVSSLARLPPIILKCIRVAEISASRVSVLRQVWPTTGMRPGFINGGA